MSELAEKIVEIAKTWEGTKWQHQGRLKQHGVDCAGFISEVARESGIDHSPIPADYHLRENGSEMLRLLQNHMEFVPTAEMQAGDVLAFCDEACREPNIPRHLAIVMEITPKTTYIIHASEHGVRKHRIDSHWRRRIHSVWRVHQ